MKLLYTDIRTSLTEILTREAEELVAASGSSTLPPTLSLKRNAPCWNACPAGFFCDYRYAFRSDGSLPGFK